MLFDAKRILVVAAHPDDEVLGCGGTLARLALRRRSIRALFLTDGSRERNPGTPDEFGKMSCREACKILGIRDPIFSPCKDQYIDRIAFTELVFEVERAIDRYRPEIIFTHYPGDLNRDHYIAVEAVLVASRPKPGCPVKAIIAFEVPSSTEWSFGLSRGFNPNLFIDIGLTIRIKIKALTPYVLEMRPFPHPRSRKAIEALASWRGAQAGLKAAEAFVLLRGIL